MCAGGAFPALVAGNLEGDAVLGTQLLQLGHDAVGEDGAASGIEAVHLEWHVSVMPAPSGEQEQEAHHCF